MHRISQASSKSVFGVCAAVEHDHLSMLQLAVCCAYIWSHTLTASSAASDMYGEAFHAALRLIEAPLS